MSHQRPSEDVTIGDKIFTITLLNVFDARKVFLKSQRLLSVFTDDKALEFKTGPVMIAAFAGGLDEELESYLVTTFGGETKVKWKDEDREFSTLGGKDAKDKLDQVFGNGNFSDLYTWLDHCLAINFKDTIAKMKADAEGRKEAEGKTQSP